MTEMSALVESGAVAFSDDGATIMDSAVMRSVLEYSRLVDKPVIVHAEDLNWDDSFREDHVRGALLTPIDAYAFAPATAKRTTSMACRWRGRSAHR